MDKIIKESRICAPQLINGRVFCFTFGEGFHVLERVISEVSLADLQCRSSANAAQLLAWPNPSTNALNN